MPFEMGFAKDELNGAQPVPAGWYTLQVKGFRPRASKDMQSWSMNAELAIVGSADHADEHNGKRVFSGLNSKFGVAIFDFVHSTGNVMDEAQNEFAGTEKATMLIPGFWENSDTNPEDPSTWKYQGPLTNATLQAELAITEYNGKKKNEVRQYKCAVPGCTEKHSTNLIKS
jgi:hypothetical protein